jgi:hypothetical protein
MARIARRRAEQEGADMLFVGERRRSRRAAPRGAERIQYRLRAHLYFSYGMPSAAGGLTRPTSPATAMMVAT